jgi:hypothetical protein
VGREDNGGCDHGTGQSPPSHLIYPAEESATLPQFPV